MALAGRVPDSQARAVQVFASAISAGAPELSGDCVQTLTRNSRPLDVPSAKVLFRQGHSTRDCYWVVRGLLKGSIAAADGEAIVVGLYGPGDLLGIPFADNLGQSLTVEAISQCELAVIDCASFQSTLHRHPEFARWLVTTVIARMRETYADAAARNMRVSGRVARALVKVATLAGESVDDQRIALPAILSQDVLASIAGVSRESTSRTLSDWRRLGIIERSVGYPIVVRIHRLRQEASA